jgi:hypothetical protein
MHVRRDSQRSPKHLSESTKPRMKRALRRNPFVYATSLGAVVLLGVGGLALPASALASDQSEAEGSILSGGGLVDLNDIASLAPAYRANPSSTGVDPHPLSASVLNALNINLGSGIQLFGGGGVLGVGALDQYAKDGPIGTAYASSGALQSSGAIAVGTPGDTSNAYIDATTLLSNAGLAPATKNLLSALRIELGAISASATKAGVAAATGDYQIAGGKIVIGSPALGTLTTGLTKNLTDLNAPVNAIAGPTGALGTTLDGVANNIVGPLGSALGALTAGLVTVNNVHMTAGLTVNLASLLSTLTATPLLSTDGITSIDLGAGTITIDLAALHGNTDHTLNNLPANTDLIDPVVLKTALNNSINSALNQIPAKLVTAVNAQLNSTTLTLHLTAHAGVGILPLANIDALITGTVGGFLGAAGSTVPTVDASGTTALGIIPVGDLVGPIVDAVVGSVLPALVTPLQNSITGLGIGNGLFQPTVDIAITALTPVLTALNDVVSLKANVQETPGSFRTTGANPIGSFTERALQLSLLPKLATPLAQVNLASATVRASAVVIPAVAITSPASGTEYDVATPTSTQTVAVVGTGAPGADISVVEGTDTEITTVDSSGNWTVSFANLPVGPYTATATQTVGTDVTTATTTFTIAAATTTTTPGTTTPGTTTPGTTTPGTTTPGTTTPGTTTPGTTTPGTTTPGTTTPGTTTPGTTTPGTTTPGTTTPGTTTPGTTTPGTTTPGTTTPGTTTPGTTTPGTTTPGTTTPGTTTPGTTTPGTTTPGTTTPGTTTPGTTTPGSTTPGTTTPGTTTPGTTTAGTTTAGTTTTGTHSNTPSSSVKYTTIERGTGVSEEIYGTGFQAGETVDAIVNSTPIPLAGQVADASGNVTWSLPIGSTFELGSHSATLTGSVSGTVDPADNHTAFTVTTAEAAGLAFTGANSIWVIPIGLLVMGVGGALLVIRRKREMGI